MNNYEKTLKSIGNADVLIQAIVYDAYGYWQRANCTEDFCLQYSDLWAGVMVFGAVNRVRWSMQSGFTMVTGACTHKFFAANSNV